MTGITTYPRQELLLLIGSDIFLVQFYSNEFRPFLLNLTVKKHETTGECIIWDFKLTVYANVTGATA